MAGSRRLRLAVILSLIFLLTFFPPSTDASSSAIPKGQFGREVVADYSRSGTRIYTTFNGIPYPECVDRCKKRTKCEFINYVVRSKMCYLITRPEENKQHPPDIVKKPGSIFGRKSDWLVDSVVDPQPPDVCGPPGDVPGSSMAGNLYQVDSKVHLNCSFAPNTSIYIKCLQSGVWQDYPNMSCLPPDFGTKCEHNGTYWIRNELACYVLLYETTLNATEAEDECALRSGHLVDVEDASEQAFIEKMLLWYSWAFDLEQRPWYWAYIGLNDVVTEGTFAWSNGATADWFNWFVKHSEHSEQSEPNGWTIENCTVLGPKFNFKWADVSCSEAFIPFCEIEFN